MSIPRPAPLFALTLTDIEIILSLDNKVKLKMRTTIIQSLRGWRYDPCQVDVARVIMPASDILLPEEALALYRRHPRNFVRLAVGREYGVDNGGADRFQRIAAALDAWREEGIFIQDRPSIYIYEQTPSGKGCYICFCLLLLPSGTVVPFSCQEPLRSVPRQNHLALMRAVRGNIEPIVCLIPDAAGKLKKLLAEMAQATPTCDVAIDGENIRLWKIEQPEALQAVAPLVDAQSLYLAETPYRCEDAIVYRNEARELLRRAGRPAPALGVMACDWILAALLPTADPAAVAAERDALLSLRPYSGLAINFFW